MATTEERLRKLVDENLEVEGRPIGQELDASKSLIDAGVNSVDYVEFMKVVATEFSLEMTAGDCENFQTLTDLIEYIEKEAA